MIRRFQHIYPDASIFGATDGSHSVHVRITHAFRGGRPEGGFECHWPQNPGWGKNDPDHPCCWITNKPCWHDGSSGIASEVYVPLFMSCNEAGDFEPLFARLEVALQDLIKGSQP